MDLEPGSRSAIRDLAFIFLDQNPIPDEKAANHCCNDSIVLALNLLATAVKYCCNDNIAEALILLAILANDALQFCSNPMLASNNCQALLQ